MNPTVLRLSAQALLGRRRFILLLVLPLVMVGLAITVRALSGPGVGYDEIMVGLGLLVAVPLIALLATSAVLGPEIDDGSIVYLLAKPVNRLGIAVSKYVVALFATLLFGTLPLLVTGLVLEPDEPGPTMGWLAGGVLAAAAYCGLFLALSSLTRHAVVAGLLFAFFWEGLMASLLTGIRWLSVSAWATQLASSVDDGVDAAGPGVGATYAVCAAVVVVLAGVWFTGFRLRIFSMRGET
jgi:ABC-2 type transport system permease protein